MRVYPIEGKRLQLKKKKLRKREERVFLGTIGFFLSLCVLLIVLI